MPASTSAGAAHAAPPFDRIDLLLLVPIVLMGLLHVPLPFTGDQAQFAIGSRDIADGAVLYRDFFDQKQPGIYAFYVVGGSLLGFTEAGFHLWELAYVVAFAIVVRIGLAPFVDQPLVARLAPLIVVGPYLLGARPYDLGQVEVLVSFPLFLALIASIRGDADPGRRRAWLAAAGAAIACVLLLKHFYALIAIAFVAHAIWRGWASGTLRSVVGDVLAVLLGISAVLAPFVIYFVANDQIERIIWTTFEYSRIAALMTPRSPVRLAVSLARITVALAPLLILAIPALIPPRSTKTRRITADLLIWVALAIPLLAIGGWYPYHFWLLVTPVAVLAVLGLAELSSSRWAARTRRMATVAVIVSCLPLLAIWSLKAAHIVTNGWGASETGRTEIQRSSEPTYARAEAEADFLDDTGARPGDIYVFGNPLYQYLSGRRQVRGVDGNGWSPEFNDPALWRSIATSLDRSAPAYIFVEADYASYLADPATGMPRFLTTTYEPVRRSDAGTWYARR